MSCLEASLRFSELFPVGVGPAEDTVPCEAKGWLSKDGVAGRRAVVTGTLVSQPQIWRNMKVFPGCSNRNALPVFFLPRPTRSWEFHLVYVFTMFQRLFLHSEGPWSRREAHRPFQRVHSWRGELLHLSELLHLPHDSRIKTCTKLVLVFSFTI